MDTKHVGFNVGGKIFTTTKDTIKLIPKTFLYALSLGDIPSQVDKDGNYTIDRNPLMFDKILDVYRIGYAILPYDIYEKELFMEELKFYQLDDLAKSSNKNTVRLVGKTCKEKDNSRKKTYAFIFVVGKNVLKVETEVLFCTLNPPNVESMERRTYYRDENHSWDYITDSYLKRFFKQYFKDIPEMMELLQKEASSVIEELSWLYLDPDEMEEIE